MNLLGIGQIVETVGQVADDLFTSDEERGKLALQGREIVSRETVAMQEVNKAEAEHPSRFVAGWRPAFGWVCAAAMAYQFVLYPLLLWAVAIAVANGWVGQMVPPPELSSDALWVIATGMLGISASRSYDKVRGAGTKGLRK